MLRAAVVWVLIGCSGIGIAQDAEAPDLEFLEYLGSWEASEEDWVLVAPEATPDKESKETEKESVDAPDGEKLAGFSEWSLDSDNRIALCSFQMLHILGRELVQIKLSFKKTVKKNINSLPGTNSYFYFRVGCS